MKPFFSIIIPAYNLENYIQRAIYSVLNQKFSDFELIVINDGSSDATLAKIEEIASKNKKITVLNHQKNESQHVSRMDGVSAANGQYVLFLDGDDYFTENALCCLNREIIKNPGCDYYEFDYIRQPSGEIVSSPISKGDKFAAYFYEENYPSHTMWNKAYDTGLLKHAVEYMERIYINEFEDLYQSIVVSYFMKNMGRIKKPVINYIIGTGISTTYKNYDKSVQFLQSTKTMLHLVQNFLVKVNLDIDLTRLNFRLIGGMIRNYIYPRKELQDRENLFYKLFEYFDKKIVVDYLLFHEIEYKRLKAIAGSLDYRMGRKLINPLRKLKNLLNKPKG